MTQAIALYPAIPSGSTYYAPDTPEPVEFNPEEQTHVESSTPAEAFNGNPKEVQLFEPASSGKPNLRAFAAEGAVSEKNQFVEIKNGKKNVVFYNSETEARARISGFQATGKLAA